MKPTRVLIVASVLGAIFTPAQSLADDLAGEQLGTIRFEVSGNSAAQAHVVRGVKLVHHMMYPEADREFAAAAVADPACAIAYWGRAMSLIHPLWPDAPTDSERKLGRSRFGEDSPVRPPRRASGRISKPSIVISPTTPRAITLPG
jgi:hypothetical protein